MIQDIDKILNKKYLKLVPCMTYPGLSEMGTRFWLSRYIDPKVVETLTKTSNHESTRVVIQTIIRLGVIPLL